MEAFLSLVEGHEFPFQVLRAMRNAALFATETRVPYGIVNIGLRDVLFPPAGNKKPTPLFIKFERIVEGAVLHAWVLARIALIFKTVEEILRQMNGNRKATDWHSFVAGCTAGYMVMARVSDTTDYKLKQQVNMFIAMRTLWAVVNYAARRDWLSKIVPAFSKDDEGRQLGWTTFVTLTWGFVMWHWRHESRGTQGEMPVAMARSMDFIYEDGDKPGLLKWQSNSAYIFAAMALYRALSQQFGGAKK